MGWLSKSSFVLAAALAAACSSSASAGEYYAGKVVTVIVPNTPAGEHSRFARMLAPYLAKYSGAREVRIDNQPGAGGLRGTNVLWNTKPDGLTLGFTGLSTLVLAQLAGSPGVQFDVSKFTYLGNVNNAPRVLLVGGESPLKTIADIKKLDRPFKMPSQGTDDDFYAMAVLFDAMDVKLKTITGYQGDADTTLAVIKGEGDGHMTTWQNTQASLASGEKRPVLTLGTKRHEGYPDVPAVTEVVTDPAKQEPILVMIDIFSVTRGLFGPPNMNEQATAEMRQAVEKSLQDPALQEEAKKYNFALTYLPGETVQQRIVQSIDKGRLLTPTMKAALQSIQ